MRFKRIVSAIDSHTEGEPARVVIGGVPPIPGATMQEKWAWAKANLDGLRKMLMFEPRGSNIMSGSILTEPVTPGADIGVIYIEVSGFLPMCGHGTIATATALVEAGIVDVREPFTELTLDTPAGLVKARIRVQYGVAQDVTIQNIPSFLYKSDIPVDVPKLGKVVLDIAYGGNFYALVPAEAVGLELVPRYIKEIIHKGSLIREAIFEQVEVVHPLIPAINRCTHVRFISPSPTPGVTRRNAVLYSAEAIDRSPCGTGTSAEMAARFAKGRQKLGEEFVSESIIGSLFYGKVVDETNVGQYLAVVPEIRGRAFISGIQQFVLDPRDPWTEGFYLGESSKWGAEF
ncbi:MAG: proline racemase family protein [Chloroflexi bacterium]|nr:proline racemase family protein [Chloroflexota bacterium]